MSAVRLPVEVFIEILSYIPTSKEKPSEPTLVSCLQANSVIRVAASASRVWEKPYRVRYTHSDYEREEKRRERFGGDWRLMYLERRRIDQQALSLLADIRGQRSGRHDRARTFTQELSFDVWDALKEESEIPIPQWFQEGIEPEQNPAREALPRRFWAKTVMGIITRYKVLKTWAQLLDDPFALTFEQALAGLSAFFDTSIQEVTAQLEDICTTCRRRLAADNTVLDPSEPGYDFWHLCEKIREVIQQLGFRLAEGPYFYALMNQFPHAFLQAGYHETIPMSLVYVFVAVARRLGIDATPANFPGVVQAHIRPPDPSEQPRLLDMRTTEPPMPIPDEVTLQDLPDVPPQADALTGPASASAMISRASNNIIMFMRYERTHGENIPMQWSLEAHEAAFYATSCWVVMESQADQLIPCPPESKPLDVVAVVLDAVCPALDEIPRNVVSTYCYRMLEVDEEKAKDVAYRSMFPEVKHFVGLLFKHKRYNYAACIFGWDPVCKQSRAWIAEMNVESLPNGRNQPFYHVFATDGHPRYVAQDNIVPAAPSKAIVPWLHKCRSAFGRYFVDVDMDEATGLGRLIPSEELRGAYPEDEQYGANWTHGWVE
ncbi:hypothetical protein BDY19DRAFT_65140 [Irpex rosettiformis]|uniref:Uncharacterized protein n=1 Tax=Irpex rosettiformis TaxID=378272 RepID=A0ACB8UL66_9APHY|nr:hypothetical protein BDY19DRAFT_65140 [Irpex rosettiformis]